MTTTLVPAEPTRAEFLASSHFRIEQDPHITQPSLKSVFKVDYPPWDISSKPPAALPPKAAEIFQKDDRYFNAKASETRKEFEYRFLQKPHIVSDADKLRGTNFKMDRDKRFNSFQTTHNAEFPPKETTPYVSLKMKPNKMRSYIPQGDKEKAPEPVSDYKDRFRGIDASHRPEVAQNMHLVGKPTILGDSRQGHFSTTHNDVYRGLTLPKIESFKPPIGSHIPQGDREKEVVFKTVQQVSYPEHNLSGLQNFDRAAVTGKLQRTNIKQTDEKCTNYLSTFKDSYRPTDLQNDKFVPIRHRNHSDFPTGDDDVYRNALRSNLTTNRYYHGNPPPTEKPDIESGSNRRTKSNVWFGEPEHVTHFYDTTMNDMYTPVDVQPIQKHSGKNSESHIPTDYYNDGGNFTTYRSDFLKPNEGQMKLNPEAIDKLKAGHIRAPLGAEMWFSTEHKDQYVPKSTVTRGLEAGRLQKSSVPIGTLYQ